MNEGNTLYPPLCLEELGGESKPRRIRCRQEVCGDSVPQMYCTCRNCRVLAYRCQHGFPTRIGERRSQCDGADPWFDQTIERRMSTMKSHTSRKELSPEQRESLLKALKIRFETNMKRHKGLEWAKVRAKLEAHTGKLWSLNEMERTGGEPDVVANDKKTGEYIFYDCSTESPKGRRSVCYDREALEARKEHPPANNAMDIAAGHGH